MNRTLAGVLSLLLCLPAAARLLPFESLDPEIHAVAELAREGKTTEAEARLLYFQRNHPGDPSAPAMWATLYTLQNRVPQAGAKWNEAFGPLIATATLSPRFSAWLAAVHIPESVMLGEYEAADVRHVQRVLAYQTLSRRIAGEGSAHAATVERLCDWVYRNIADEVAEAAKIEDFPAWPYDVLLRGYGACDRMAWVYAALARQRGLYCTLIYLRTPGSGLSRHTLVGVRRGDEWELVDPQNGLVLRDAAGAPLTLSRVAAHPEAVDPYPSYARQGLGRDFAGAQMWLPGEPEAYRPRMRVLHEWFALLGWPVELYEDAIPPGLPARPWPVPFQVARNFADQRYLAVRESSIRLLSPMFSARILQINGRWSAAAELYGRLQDDDLEMSDVQRQMLHWFEASAHFDAGNEKEARRLFTRYLDETEQPLWAREAWLYLGRIEESRGKPKEALEAYRKAAGHGDWVEMKIAELDAPASP